MSSWSASAPAPDLAGARALFPKVSTRARRAAKRSARAQGALFPKVPRRAKCSHAQRVGRARVDARMRAFSVSVHARQACRQVLRARREIQHRNRRPDPAPPAHRHLQAIPTRRRSNSSVGVSAERHRKPIPTRRQSNSSLGVGAERHLKAGPTRRRSYSSLGVGAEQHRRQRTA